jgi:hypothetical protein
MKKFISAILLTTTVMLLSSINLFAQKRINFRRGSTSATVSGIVDGSEMFLFHANVGQVLTVTVSSSNGEVYLIKKNTVKNYTATATWAGDHEIAISNQGKFKTRYTLTVSVR